jgi:hypothetical protein
MGAGRAAAVVAAQGRYVNERVAVHLSQQRARSEQRRRRQARAQRGEGRRQQQRKARQAVARAAERQVVSDGEQPLDSSQDSSRAQNQSDAGGASAASAGVGNGCSQVDQLQKQNEQSWQPAEPAATLQRSSAALQVEQMVDDSLQSPVANVDGESTQAQSTAEPIVDGRLLTFVMPAVTSGSVLRLKLDGDDIPVIVKVPPRVCKGDVITGKVSGGCLHITKVEMAGCEGSGGSVGQ